MLLTYKRLPARIRGSFHHLTPFRAQHADEVADGAWLPTTRAWFLEAEYQYV